jgi:hypothetical protein
VKTSKQYQYYVNGSLAAKGDHPSIPHHDLKPLPAEGNTIRTRESGYAPTWYEFTDGQWRRLPLGSSLIVGANI